MKNQRHMLMLKRNFISFRQGVPLRIRMALYSASFLICLVLILPWIAYRFDILFPHLHCEIGWWRAAGVTMFILFLGAYIWSAFVLSFNGAGAYVEFDPPRQFVSTGPYLWSRNPIAMCVLGIIGSEAIALSSTGLFLVFVAAIPIAHLQVVLLEEPLLRKRFGQTYKDYCNRVPRWIPNIFR